MERNWMNHFPTVGVWPFILLLLYPKDFLDGDHLQLLIVLFGFAIHLSVSQGFSFVLSVTVYCTVIIQSYVLPFQHSLSYSSFIICPVMVFSASLGNEHAQFSWWRTTGWNWLVWINEIAAFNNESWLINCEINVRP